MLYICIVSNKFDLKQTIRVLHIMLSVIMLNVVMLSVPNNPSMLSVIILSVVILS